MKILVIDNYDSFTYNLVQLIATVVGTSISDDTIRVRRNDAVSVEDIAHYRPNKIVISPGPGGPEDGGVSREVIEHFSPSTPTLGVCLGHQILGTIHGATVVRAPTPVHGKTVQITHTNSLLFQGVPSPTTVCRYHSLCIEANSVHHPLSITARTSDDIVMAVEHKSYPLYGVQFHPESFLTPDGGKIISNFLAI